jgi:hypothetical protein
MPNPYTLDGGKERKRKIAQECMSWMQLAQDLI